MKKITYVEPLMNVFVLSAFDYFLASGNAPTIGEDDETGFNDF